MATLNRNLVRPELWAAWQHDYGDVAYPIDSQFALDAGGLFTAHAATSSQNSALMSAAVAVQWSERVSTCVYYDGQLVTMTTATLSTADYGSVSEESVLQAGVAMRLDKSLLFEKHHKQRIFNETIHSNDCYSAAVILLRCMRAIEKPRGKCVSC